MKVKRTCAMVGLVLLLAGLMAFLAAVADSIKIGMI